jgi:hypothetical protein
MNYESIFLLGALIAAASTAITFGVKLFFQRSYKYLLLLIALLSLTGVANFFATKVTIPQKSQVTSDYFIENDHIKLNLNNSGGIIHSIELKKWKNSYNNSNQILLTNPMNYTDCIESGFQGDGFPDRTSKWTLEYKTNNSIAMRSHGSKYTIIKLITLKEDSLLIKDTIQNYNGLAQRYTCINGNGNSEGNFFVKTDQNNKSLENFYHQPSLFNFYKKFSISKFDAIQKKDFFGFKSNDNFVIAIRDNSDTGHITYYTDQTSVRMFKTSMVSGASGETEVFVLPHSHKDLGKYGMDDIMSYGWFKILSRQCSIGLEKILQWTNFGFSGFVFAMLLYTLLMLPVIFWLARRKESAKTLEARIMRELGSTFSPQSMIWRTAKFHISTIVVQLFVNIFTFWIFLRLILKNCFYLKQVHLLWIQDFSMSEIGSVFNLYGLLNFDLPSILAHFGVIKLWFLLCVIIVNSRELEVKKKLNKGPELINPKYMLWITCFVFLSWYSTVGQMLGYCIFTLSRDGITALINRYYANKITYTQI